MSTLFFFNDTATTEIYTLSLHDALPICDRSVWHELERYIFEDLVSRDNRYLPHKEQWSVVLADLKQMALQKDDPDRKSTRLNSSHGYISYAVFCLKKKNNTHIYTHATHH